MTIPYVDPALSFNARKDALQSRYGFICDCSWCEFAQHRLQRIPAPPPRKSAELQALEFELRAFVFGGDATTETLPITPDFFDTLPARLYSLLHESYLPALSEIFSDTSHDGPHDVALLSGRTLLALYLVIYPPRYPQIGERLFIPSDKHAHNVNVDMRYARPRAGKDSVERICVARRNVKFSRPLSKQSRDSALPRHKLSSPQRFRLGGRSRGAVDEHTRSANYD